MSNTRCFRGLSPVFTLLLLSCFVPGTAARGEEWVPKIEPASDEAEQAIPRFRVPQGFKVTLFAAEPRLANPVAFDIDHKGRFYVVETFRYHGGVLDVRGFMDWLDDDTACRTVADRRKMVLKHRGEQGVREMEVASDRVKLIEDRDGDGRADFDALFTAGDNKLEDGIGSGVLARWGDVYYANIPSLYRLRDADGDGKAEIKESLQYGYGVRYAYVGHDLHGLRMGPDGKLYFSVGDRGLNIEKSVDGRRVQNVDHGAVLRCNPDGTELELVHVGLRNPQELAFDQYGNLFTGDNNSDGGDQARWVQVVEGGDSGWRIGYQHQEFPVSRGPWNFERIWLPDGQTPAPIFYRLPPIAILPASGPSGLTYTPGTAMPKEWQDRFLLCDFRGGTGSGVWAIRNTPKGATFEMKAEQFVWEILATDVEFGYDGGVYISDWTNGWDRPGKGRLYRFEHPEIAGQPAAKQTAKLMADGFTKREPAELARLLAHPDMRIRLEAQFELAGRGDAAAEPFAAVAKKPGTNPLARLHAIWGLGQIGRKAPAALKPVLPLLADPDDEVRAQAAKVVGDAAYAEAYDGLVKLLADKSSRVRFFAAVSIGKLGRKDCLPQVAAVLRENNDQDAYLRHAGVMALAGIARADKQNLAAVLSMAKDESPAVRMGVLLALRKLQSPQIAQFLNDKEPNLVLEAARAINDVPIFEAMPALAALLDRADLPQKEPRDEMVLMRVLNANWKLGTAEAAKRLAAYAAKQGNHENYRLEAVRMLGEWSRWGGRDRIVGVWRTPAQRDPAVAKTAASAVLGEILNTAPDAVRAAAVGLIERLSIDDPAVLTRLAGSNQMPPKVRAAALGALAAANDPRLADALRTGLSDPDPSVRLAAIRLATRLPDGVKHLRQAFEQGGVPEKQAAIAALAADTNDLEADTMLSDLLDELVDGQLPPELHLDVMEAAARRKDKAFDARLQDFEKARSKTDPYAPYRETLAGGDAEAGRRIFLERADVSCLKCHAVKGQGGNAGPDLAGVGTKHPREYLLESIINPAKTITPGFESVMVRQKNGDVVVGVLKAETGEELQLDVPEKGLQTIRKADIDRRKGGQSAMPSDIAKSLSKRDLRNLVEFLASLK